MKATGVVRRIDELGRIVVPKEIRKTLRIREGENLEIYTDSNDQIILKKFSYMKRVDDFAQQFTDSIYSLIKKNILITNTDNIVAMSGPLKKEYLNKSISNQLEQFLLRREEMLEKYEKEIKITEDKKENASYIISSIVANGDVAGLIIIFSSDSKVDELDEKIVKIASQFLSKHLED